MIRFRPLLLTALLIVIPATAMAKPAKAPRLSAGEMQTVRSWNRVLDVLEQKMRPVTSAMTTEVAETIKACPGPTENGVALTGDAKEFAQGIATLGFVMIHGLASQVRQVELAATRVRSLPVRSPALRAWQRMQARDLADAARLGTMMTESGDPCAFMQLLVDAPKELSAEQERQLMGILGVPAANQDAARALTGASDARDAARTRAESAANVFLSARGMAKIDLTRDLTIFS